MIGGCLSLMFYSWRFKVCGRGDVMVCWGTHLTHHEVAGQGRRRPIIPSSNGGILHDTWNWENEGVACVWLPWTKYHVSQANRHSGKNPSCSSNASNQVGKDHASREDVHTYLPCAILKPTYFTAPLAMEGHHSCTLLPSLSYRRKTNAGVTRMMTTLAMWARGWCSLCY